MALGNCKELEKKRNRAADGQLLSYDKYTFDHFPASCGGDDEGDRAATPYSNCTTSTLPIEEFRVN